MHIGLSAFFQNRIPGTTDRDVYRHEAGLADRAEGLGFDSVWAAEHHFDNYTMCPNVAQFLTWMAGRTERVKLGSMVMVLPWHDPVRVAEEVSVLDHLSGGRTILGIGRGLGRIEFHGFRREMGESRARFVEYSEAILEALETGFIEYDGAHYRQPRKQIRPFPFKSFRGRVYASAVSPESARIMARLGVGVMIIAQKPWDKTLEELAMYREAFREYNDGAEAPKPLVACFTAVSEDSSAAGEMREYIRAYARSAVEHYEFENAGLADIPGYEYYGGLARNIEKHGVGNFANFLADLQICGTPREVVDRMREYRELTDCAAFMCTFSYGGMPYDLARENLRTFAERCLPTLKEIEIDGAQDALRVAA